MARTQSVGGWIMRAMAGVVAAGALGASGGCHNPPPTEPGAYTYAGGELEDVEAVSLDKAFSAALSAVEELQLRPAGQTKDGMDAQVSAETIDHTSVHIKMKARGAGSTEFRVRDGWFGDRDKSE